MGKFNKSDKKAYLKKIDGVIAAGKYKDDWDSLKNIEIPEWYAKDKFGIFSHWGVYSVPAFGNEWYPRSMYTEGSKEFEHHAKTYGEHKKFGYKDFVPMFRAKKFDPDEWLDLFDKAGAKFFVPVAEHHDGFQMYRSNISSWNAFDKGPKRDIIGELKAAADKRGIRLGVSSHRIEHWWFMNGGKKFGSDMSQNLKEGDLYWPSMPEHDDFHNRTPLTFMASEYKKLSRQFAEDWLIRCCELVDSYKPATFFFDWWIQVEPLKPYLKKFAAYYYNKTEEWGKTGVIHYKFDAMAFGTAVIDVERGQFGELKPFPWQTDTSIARNSWGYTENNIFKKTPEILKDFVDIVSKNGCLLLNIGPKADGTIADEEKKVLLEIGDWLKANGEAIYNTTPFKIFGEGPTEVFTREGDFTDAKEKIFTSEDIRFTQNGSNLYAAVLKYPDGGKVNIKSLGQKSNVFFGSVKDVDVLGFDEKPVFERTDGTLMISTKTVKSENPVVFKIKID
jgi:alpha-L-fucosidase